MTRNLKGGPYATQDATNEEIQTAICNAKQNDVAYIMQAGTFLTEIDREIEICEKFSDKDINIICALANHPENVKTTGVVTVDELVNIAKKSKYIKAIGETGLDTHKQENYGFLNQQIKSFENHIQAGIELNLPIIIHAYGAEAIEKCIDIITNVSKKSFIKYVFHCYDGTYEQAKQIIDSNGVISFSGTITFKKRNIAREMIKQIPIENFVIETDAPFLSPEPKRGVPNETSYVKYIAEYISNFLQIDYDKFCNQMTENGLKLFNN